MLVRWYSLSEHRPSVRHVGIHPSVFWYVHQTSSSGSAPTARPSHGSPIVPKWDATMQEHEFKENNTWCMSAHDATQHNAIKKKTWLGNHLSSKHNQQAQKTKGLVLQNKSSLNVFSLKGFLQKVLLNLFRRG